MSTRLSDGARNAMADAFETYGGASPILQIYSGSRPGSVGGAATGTLLAEITLGADWLTAASAGVKTLNGGPYSDTAANNTGTAGWARLVRADLTTVISDHTVTVTGGGGSVQLASTTITQTQPVEITSISVTMPVGG